MKRKDFSEIVLEPHGNNNFTKPKKLNRKLTRPDLDPDIFHENSQ